LFIYRNLHFLACFLYEFGQGDKSVEDAMNKAYGQTLKRFHGWTTRGVFSVNYLFIKKINKNLFQVAFRSVPYNEDFLVSLAVYPNDAREVLFERQVRF
jgi:hypothetical protein